MNKEIKQIGNFGEKLVKRYLKEKGLYVERGFGKDLRVYLQEPSDNRSKVSNYATCEVKTSTQKHVHKPNEHQRKRNHILAQVKIKSRDEILIRFRFLKSSKFGNFFEEKLPTEWEKVRFLSHKSFK